jgi:hypothetical protein
MFVVQRGASIDYTRGEGAESAPSTSSRVADGGHNHTGAIAAGVLGRGSLTPSHQSHSVRFIYKGDPISEIATISPSGNWNHTVCSCSA